jgi:phosphoribosylamine-glycine ligase
VAGSSGGILTAAGTGNMPQQARRRAYQLLDKVQVPNKGYRVDIAERWPGDLDRLREWGYLGTPGA